MAKNKYLGLDGLEIYDEKIKAHIDSIADSKANASDLTSHTGNKSNPHGVTKAQVGLGSVENKSSAAIRGELTKANVTDALGYTPPTTNTTYSVVSTTADGLAPKRSGTTTKFLRDDGTWAVPTNTTYSAGTGISLSGTTFSNAGVRDITPSTANGGICFDLNGTTKEVFVCGLKSAAYTESSAYAAASHSHSYLPLSGGTLTGSLGLGANSLIVGGATFSYDQTSHVLDIAKTSGNTASAIGVKLGTKTVGSATQPIYFNAGTPTACTYTLGKSVPSDAKFTDTVYTLPNATASVLGGVKVGSNISVSSGTISLTKANVTAALGYTPPTSDTNTTYSAGTGISLSGTTFSNSGVRSIATGSSNGTISVNTNGTSANVAVKGLGSAAYTASTAYAAATHYHGNIYYAGNSSNPGVGWFLDTNYFFRPITNGVTKNINLGSTGFRWTYGYFDNVVSTTVDASQYTVGAGDISIEHPSGNSIYFGNKTNQGLEYNYTDGLTLSHGTLTCSGTRIKCLPSYNNTVTYAANMYVGNTGVYSRTTNTSSRTIKHDIKELQDDAIAAENLYKLPIYQAKYNEDIITDIEDCRYLKDLPMFIIEDMDEIYPVAVDKPDEDVKTWSWNAQYLLPPMLKLIQDQKKQIDSLEKRLEALEA